MQQLGPESGEIALSRWAGCWVSWVVGHPGATLIGLLLSVLLAIGAATRLSVDTDSSRMLAADLSFQERANALNAAFPQLKNQVVAVISADSADAADAAAAALSSALEARGDQFDWVFAPSADPWLQGHGLLYLDRDKLDSRLARLGKSANLLARLRADQSVDGFLGALGEATALAEASGADLEALDPFYDEAAAVLAAAQQGARRDFRWQEVLGNDDDVTAGGALRVVTAGPRLDYSALNPAKAALGALRAAVAELDPALLQGVEIGITGDPALRSEELESVRAGIGVSLVLSLALVALLLRVALGSLARTVLAMGTLMVTLTLTAGFAGLAVGALNLISIAFVVLMVGLGIDFAIHFLAHFDEHGANGQARGAALARTARSIGGAMGLSALTTAIAFLAFTATDFVGMAQLGLIGGSGVMIALAVAMTAIPALIMVWPALDAGPRTHALPAPPPGVTRWLGRAVIAAAVTLALAAPLARFDADPMSLRNPDAASVRAYDRLADVPSRAPLRLSLMTRDAQAAAADAARLEKLGEVRSTVWLGDLVPQDQEAKLDLIDLAYPSILHAVEGAPTDLSTAEPGDLIPRLQALGTPAAKALAGELAPLEARRDAASDADLQRRLFRYFPALIQRLALQLEAGPVTVENLPEALRRLYLSPDRTYRVEIVPEGDLRDPAALTAFTQAVARVAPGAAGPPDQIAGAAGTVSSAILGAAALALAGCALLAWLTLRHLGRTIAILLPLGLAAAATMGASALGGIAFNYANVIVVPLMIGIGIDSGVHLAMRSGDAPEGVFATSTPRAVLFSALTTIAAFGTLGLSDHRGTASMGILLAIALTLSVVVVFALTPALVRRFSGS